MTFLDPRQKQNEIHQKQIEMPIDFRAIVREQIAREKKELDDLLAAAKKKQAEAEKAVAEDLVLRDYVEEEVARDPALHGVWDALNLADHLQDGLKISEDGGTTQDPPTLLGLKEDEILPTKSELKEFQDFIIPRVAQRIEADRDRLLRYCNKDAKNLSTTSSTPLCDAINELQSRLQTERQKLAQGEDKQEELLLSLAQIYEDMMLKMLQMLRESYPIVVQGEIRAVEENLAKFQCLDLKAKATRLKLMTHVYTPPKVVKLKNIRYTLNKKMAEVETEYAKWSEALRKFDGLGAEFLSVADDFKSVIDAIQAHEYILKQYS